MCWWEISRRFIFTETGTAGDRFIRVVIEWRAVLNCFELLDFFFFPYQLCITSAVIRSSCLTFHARYERRITPFQKAHNRAASAILCFGHPLFLFAQNPDPWYSAFHYSHPPLVERLQAMGASPDAKKRE